MSEREQRLIEALVCIVSQCYEDWDRGSEYVDSIGQSAGETAILVLIEFGLLEPAHRGRIAGRWTDQGRAVRDAAWGIGKDSD